jgi:hypothetical protein
MRRDRRRDQQNGGQQGQLEHDLSDLFAKFDSN